MVNVRPMTAHSTLELPTDVHCEGDSYIFKDPVNNIMDKFNASILSMKLIDEKNIYINLIDAVRTFNCYHDS